MEAKYLIGEEIDQKDMLLARSAELNDLFGLHGGRLAVDSAYRVC